jgi:hypothetical protein
LMNCKYEKCSVSVLRKFLKQHEEEECEHREKLCTKVCGLMIPVRIYEDHDCVEELRKYSQGIYCLTPILLCLCHNMAGCIYMYIVLPCSIILSFYMYYHWLSIQYLCIRST